jgi:hypothetical protein
MPWSGGTYTRTNGTYNGAGVWASDAAALIKIQSSRHDTHDQDLATGINACVAKDGSNTITSLNLTATVNATTGVITIGGVTFANMRGTQNVYVGNAGVFAGSGFANVAVGDGAFASATVASHSVAVGVSCLSSCTVGLNNVAVGNGALSQITTGNTNIGIGYAVQVPSATATGQLTIQNAIFGVNNIGNSNGTSTGNLGFYVQAPTARVHFPAGSATANTAPIKLTAGTLLGTPEDGALEYDGTHLYFTHGVTRTQIV